MEKVENCEADVSSRKRRHSSLEHSESVPQSERFYSEPQPLFVAKKISRDKSTFSYPPGKCTMWFDEQSIGNNTVATLFISYEGKFLFSDRWLLTVKLTTPQYPEGQLQTFNIGCPNKILTFDIDVPEDDDFDLDVCDFQPVLNGDILTQTAYGHRFDNADLPHDVVLNFGDKKLYCFKVILAMVSYYFDRLFFSETADQNMTCHNLPDFKAESVMKLLNIGVYQDGKVTDVGWNIRDLQALFFLEMHIFENDANSRVKWDRLSYSTYTDSEHGDMCANVVVALELSDKYNLTFLQDECAVIFLNYFSCEQKKNFLAENTDRLKKLNWKTLIKFTTEGFGRVPSIFFDAVFNETVSNPSVTETYARKIDKLKDVTFLVGGRRFKAHRKYLAFCSPYFERLFFGGFGEVSQDEVELKDIDRREFSSFLKKIYSPGNIVVNSSNVEFLLKLADRFQVKSIMILCGMYLDKRIQEYDPAATNRKGLSLMDLVELADNYNFIDAQTSFLLKLKSMNQSVSNDFRATNSSRFEKLSRRLMKNIILSL